jgi:thiamine-phosphate pyrophosphorylase
MQLPRFYPILDALSARKHGVEIRAGAAALLEAGTKILQVRHKCFISRDVMLDIEAIAEMCARRGATLVVNDRADLARLFGAALHLGQDDLPPEVARRVTGEDIVIGFSTHNEAQLRAAALEPVNYLALGPVFGTASKDNPDPVVGLDELRRLRALTARPVVAIGGITRATARSVLEAGADSVAVIGDLFPEDGKLGARAEEWMRVAG